MFVEGGGCAKAQCPVQACVCEPDLLRDTSKAAHHHHPGRSRFISCFAATNAVAVFARGRRVVRPRVTAAHRRRHGRFHLVPASLASERPLGRDERYDLHTRQRTDAFIHRGISRAVVGTGIHMGMETILLLTAI